MANKKKSNSKKNKKKTSRKTIKSVKKNKISKKIIIYSIISMVVLAAIIITALKITQVKVSEQDASEKVTHIEEGNPVAYINGIPIYQEELDLEYERIVVLLPPNLDPAEVKKAVLFNMINERLMLQEAEKMGIKATDKDVEAEIKLITSEYGITEEQFYENAEIQGMTKEESNERLKKQIIIMKIIEEKGFDKIDASEEEINQYLTTPAGSELKELVTTKHILVLTQNRTDEEAKAIIEEVKAEFDADHGTFCDLVEQYSEDPGSVNNCGLYSSDVLPNFVQEYQDVAYTNQEDEASIAKSVFGYHLVWSIDKISVQEQARKTVISTKQKQALSDYLALLMKNVNITNCLEKPETAICTGETPEVKTNMPELETNMPKLETDMDKFAKCLTENKAKIYGAYWNTETSLQTELFGASLKYIDYVECTPKENPREQTMECKSAKIKGYPTWIINGEVFAGKQSLETLSSVTGCKI